MIALVVIIIGVAIRLWAIMSMRGKFTFKIQAPDKVCTKGAYKYVRHPSYVGSFFILCGTSMLSPAVGVCYLAFAFFMARAIQEEVILNQYADYIIYKQKTGMFIPKLRSQEN
jgi:protein-S-isoprenylcysteine O-methyltransferase Ste14